jgi:hypothetical protein
MSNRPAAVPLADIKRFAIAAREAGPTWRVRFVLFPPGGESDPNAIIELFQSAPDASTQTIDGSRDVPVAPQEDIVL